MSLKDSKTTSAYIEWETVQSLILKLRRDGDWKFSLIVAIGSYTGLRISDILVLKWIDILDKDTVELTEKKTKKYRKITINPQFKAIIASIYNGLEYVSRDELIFINRWGTGAITSQYVNHKLKQIAKKYKITKDPSTIKSHSLRKSFGRRVFENNDNSDKALIILSEMLNHSSIKTTKIYLGIREAEIQDVYVNL